MAELAAKKCKISDDDDPILTNFLKWMKDRRFVISPKVKITKDSVHRYGLVALEDIEEGEELFKVPR